MDRRSIVVVSAGISQPSSTRLLADRLVTAVSDALGEIGLDAAAERVEVRDYAQDLTNNLLTGFPGARLREVTESLVRADGLIAVTPIFTPRTADCSSCSSTSWSATASPGSRSSIAATGGTARHSLALDYAMRPLFAYLGAAVSPTAVFAAAEDWGTGADPIEGALVDRIERAAREFATALAMRPSQLPLDPFADPLPFEELLREQGRPRRARGE